MGSRTLSEDFVSVGKSVLAAVDELGLRPEGAFWLFEDETPRWEFYVITSFIDISGPQYLFLKLNAALPKVLKEMPPQFAFNIIIPNETLAEEVRRATSNCGAVSMSPFICDFGDGRQNLVMYRIGPTKDIRSLHKSRIVFRKKLREVLAA